MMIDYLQKTETGTVILAQNGTLIELDEPLSRILNRLALNRLSTVEARVETTKKVFHLRSKVPLWISEDILLIPIKGVRSSQCCLINYFALFSCKNAGKGTILVAFSDGNSLSRIPVSLFQKQRRICAQIESFMQMESNGFR